MERPTGSLGVNPAGNAVYTYPIEVPPGIGTDNQPDLSLSYSQSTDSSGVCGLRWSLNGLSSIFCTPPIAAIEEKLKDAKITLEHRYALDGAQLLCTSGVYGGLDAVYSTETNATEEIRGSAASGFIVTNDDGRVREYGTTPDSLIYGYNGMAVEWKLKKSSDCFGNYMIYTYTESPRLRQTKQPSASSGSLYIDNIKYTSNDAAGYQGRLMVDFFYGDRNDVVLASNYGTTSRLAHRLEQIETGVLATDNSYIQMARAYRLQYNYSPDSGDSLLGSITELSSRHRALTPTKFTYSTNGGQLGYDYSFQDTTHFYNLHDTISVIPVDIRGKNTGDVVTVQRSRATGSSQLVSYFADLEESPKQSVNWTQSSGFRAYATLPRLDPRTEPNILIADLNHDGRTDIIIPYKDVYGRLMFSVSRAKTQGFEDAVILPSGQSWHPNSKFFALDTNGNGLIDIVEVVYHASNYCEIQTYFDICQVRPGELPSFAISEPWYERGSTVEWVVIRHHISGSTGLVHITNVDSRLGLRDLCATTFKSTSLLGGIATFTKGPTSILTSYDYSDGTERSVLSCDINGDGTTDLVLCSMKPSLGNFKFNLIAFIHDGQGIFKKGQDQTFTIKNDMLDMSKKGQFMTVSLDNGRYPSVGYLYPDSVTNSWVLLSGRGNSQGNIPEFRKTTLFSAITAPIDSFKLTQADLNGNGVSDWLAYRITGSTFSLCPIYSKLQNAELLAEVTNPLGLRQKLSYASLNSSVYSAGPDIDGQKYAAADDFSDVICLGGKAQVVASIREDNDPSINAITHVGRWSYSYEGLKLSRRNLGILGFSSVSRVDELAGIRNTTIYSQTWPLVGFPIKIDTYGCSEDNLRKRMFSTSRSWDREPLVLMQSKMTTATSYKRASPNNAPVYLIQISKEETKTFDPNGTSCTIGKRWEYRAQTVHKILEASYAVNDSDGAILSQLFTRTSYAAPTAGVKNLISATKISASPQNTNLALFENGDFSLTKNEYSANGAVSKIDTWSTDLQKFVATVRTTNKYGLEIDTKDETGLTTKTSYDSIHPSYATSVVSEGPGVRSTERTAYDPKFGVVVASLSDDGVLTTDSQDDWGRSWLRQITATDSGGKPFTMNSTVERIVAIDDTFKTLISQTPVHAMEEQKYDLRGFSKSLCGTTTMVYKDAMQAKRPEIELVDCLGATCRTLEQDNGQAEVYCMATKYDSTGAPVMKSLPYILADLQNIDHLPNENQAVHKAVDALGREIITVRPQNNNRKGWVGVIAGYSLAGRQRNAQVYSIDTLSAVSAWSQQSGGQSSQQFLRINEEDRLLSTTNAEGKTTRFDYDAMGRLTKLTDPSGKSEIRKYNSMGSVTSVDDPYQNPLRKSQGLTSLYDAANRLVSETNALGQVMTWKYDALGRVIERTGVMSDSTIRSTTWTYESSDNSWNRLSRVEISQGDRKPQLSYDYSYDARGRVVSMTLSSKDVVDKSWTTKYSYDRQDNVITKVMPDNTRTENTFVGSSLVRSNMISPEGQSWNLSVQNESFNGFGAPKSCLIQGQGNASCRFRSSTVFDVNGSVNRLLLQGGEGQQTLAGLDFAYNDMDQITQMTNLVNSQSISYSYKAGRLVTSRGKNFERSYTYNDSGDLIVKDGMSISVSPSGQFTETTGTKNGKRVISAKSDAAGRLIERQAGDGPTVFFEYDENGKISKASSTNGVKRFVANHNLSTVLQINSNGDIEVNVEADYSETLSSGGSKTIKRSLRATEHAIGSMNTFFETSTSAPNHSLEIYMRDHKGSLTHVFNADGTLKQEYEYDDFGARTVVGGGDTGKKSDASYEDMNEDEFSGLLDFQARMYDPILGKFTTPDTMLELAQAILTDGLNRMVFENNDPINHIDPTGHMTWEAKLGIGLGVALVVAGIILGAATAGVATPLAGLGIAMLTGALIGAGVSSVTYSLKYSNREKGQFWQGWAAEVAIGAAIGAVTGAFTAGAGGLAARAGTEIARTGGTHISALLAKAAIHGGIETLSAVSSTVVSLYANNAVNNAFMHEDNTVTGEQILTGIGMKMAGKAGGKVLGKIGGKVGTKLVKKPILKKWNKYQAKKEGKSPEPKPSAPKGPSSYQKFKDSYGSFASAKQTLLAPHPMKYTFMRLEVS